MAIPGRVCSSRIGPAPRFRGEGSHDCNREGSVLRLAVEDRCDGIVERHPAQFDVRFLFSGTKIGRSASRPRARKTRTASLLPPGVGKKSTSTSQFFAVSPVSSRSSLRAADMGSSLGLSRMPAGSSHSRARTGWRYC